METEKKKLRGTETHLLENLCIHDLIDFAEKKKKSNKATVGKS